MRRSGSSQWNAVAASTASKVPFEGCQSSNADATTVTFGNRARLRRATAAMSGLRSIGPDGHCLPGTDQQRAVLHEPGRVRPYSMGMEHICEAAEHPDRTVPILEQVLRRI